MENIWLIFWINVVDFIILIITGIILYIKKSKHYILSNIIIIFLLIFLLVNSVPFIKDISKQETTEITAIYVKYEKKGSVNPGAWILVLKDENETYKIILPVVTKIHLKMEIGKTYKVEYYNNTKIIKDYILIE